MTARQRNRKGQGSLKYHAPTGTWLAQVSLGLDAQGKRIRVSKRTPSKVEAKAWLEREVAHLTQAKAVGASLVDAPRDVAGLVTYWLEVDLVGQVTDVGSLGAYRTQAARITKYLGTVPLSALGAPQVKRALLAMQRDGLKASTVNLTLRALRRVLRVALGHGWVTRNVASEVRPLAEDAAPIRYLSEAEAVAVAKACEGERYGLAVLLALCSGLRSGEVRGLRWQDVDLEARTLTVAQQVKPGGGLGTPKTAGSLRTVGGLAPWVVAKVRAAKPADADPSALIFTNAHGAPVNRSVYYSACQAVYAKAGLEGSWGTHTLRHTAATGMLRAGAPLEAVGKAMGHTKLATTMRYAKVNQEAADLAASRWADALSAGGAA